MLKAWPLNFVVLSMHVVFFSAVARAEFPKPAANTSWVLPVTLNDDNTEVRYGYRMLGKDSSGRSHGIHGKVWLENSDIRSVRAQMTIPAPQLNSAASDLLGPFAEMLKNTQLPAVTVTISRLVNLCLPREILPGKDCMASMEGRAQFGAISRDLKLPVRIQRKTDMFVVKGEGELDTSAAAVSPALQNVVESATFEFTITLPS